MIQIYTSIIIKRSSRGLSRQQVINNLIEHSIITHTSAIFFSFSRKYCEKLGYVTGTICRNRRSIVDKIIDFNLRKLITTKPESMDQFIQLKNACYVIAFHHSGLLPVFKEIVEILFAFKDVEGKPNPCKSVVCNGNL